LVTTGLYPAAVHRVVNVEPQFFKYRPELLRQIVVGLDAIKACRWLSFRQHGLSQLPTRRGRVRLGLEIQNLLQQLRSPGFLLCFLQLFTQSLHLLRGEARKRIGVHFSQFEGEKVSLRQAKLGKGG
jgi:hypothetical protein